MEKNYSNYTDNTVFSTWNPVLLIYWNNRGKYNEDA